MTNDPHTPESPRAPTEQELAAEEERLLKALSDVTRQRRVAATTQYELYYKEFDEWFWRLRSKRPLGLILRLPYQVKGNEPANWRACSWSDDQMTIEMSVDWTVREGVLENVTVALQGRFDAKDTRQSSFMERADGDVLETAATVAFRRLAETTQQEASAWADRVHALESINDALNGDGEIPF